MATLEKVNPKTLQFSPWNVNSVDPENMAKLRKSIERNGIYRPVIVREREDGALEVIAGEHTTRCAIDLGYKELQVFNLGPIDEAKAKEISVIDNRHYGQEDTFALAELLNEIGQDVGEFMPYSEEDLTAIFASTTVDLSALDSLDDEDFQNATEKAKGAPVTHQIMRFKVPLGDAEMVQRVVDAIIKRQKLTDQDSLINAGDALVHLCREFGNN